MADMERITFRASDKFKSALLKLAKLEHRTLSDQVRMMLHKVLVEKPKEKN